MTKEEQLLTRITTNSAVMTGKPVILGTRLTVQFIIDLLAHGETIDSILAEYADLQRDDILACLKFASETIGSSSFIPLESRIQPSV